MGKRITGTEQCSLWNKLAWGNGEQALNSAGFGINWHGETGTGTLELALFSGTNTCNGIYFNLESGNLEPKFTNSN